jgi:hypothetical protein
MERPAEQMQAKPLVAPDSFFIARLIVAFRPFRNLVRIWSESSVVSRRSRRQHKAWGGAHSARAQEDDPSRPLSPRSQPTIYRPFRGLADSGAALPGVALTLYAVTRFAGWNKELAKQLQILTTALLFVLPTATAVRAERLSVKVYTTADGLVSDRISRIVRDPRDLHKAP